MSTIAGVGLGYEADAYNSGVMAATEAVQQLRGAPPKVILVFSSVQYDQQKMLDGVRSVSKDILLVGCSTAGEIITTGPVNRHSVAVMAIAADQIQFFAGVGKGIAQDPRAAGREAAEAVARQTDEQLKAFMMFPDVLAGNGAEIVRGVLESLGEHFPVVGGAPGDDFLFKQTYQYLNNKVYSGSVVALGMTGKLHIGIGVKHGWIPVGKPMIVTKSEGSLLYEVDNQPAIKVYEDYFGKERAAELREKALAQLAITYPLGMKVEGSNELLIRDPISVDEKGAITCAAEIPEGSEIRLMVGSREKAVEVAKEAAEAAVSQLGEAEPRAVIIFNCIARNKLFGEHAGDEIDAIKSAVGIDVPLIGFYTYGEQAPLGGEVRNIEKCNSAFHNETVVIFVIGE
jgi:hypothetical protein